ncbi:MAG: cytochrome B [Rhodobacteraceae bacterium]|nr:cytochrome B [Paracoccaceae bacterium]
MQIVKVWDPLVRLAHWSMAGFFITNALLTDEDGKLHQWIGYAVVGVVLVRVLWGFVGSKHARLKDFPLSVSGALDQLSHIAHQRNHVRLGHTPLGAWMIYNLWATMLFLGLTGWLMTTTAFWGVDWVEEVHEVLVSWAWVSVAAHVGGVILESRLGKVNLVKAMVTGSKAIPASASPVK